MLARAVQGAVGVSQQITWTQDDGETPIDLTGYTLTGTIQPIDSAGDIRAIAGALAVGDGDDGIFTWTYAAGDLATPGDYLVQFKAVLSGVTVYSFAAYWIVEPAGGIQPFSLPALRARLIDNITVVDDIPTPIQCSQAIKSAVAAVNSALPLKKQAVLNIVSGTDTYDVPDDFLFAIDLHAVIQGSVGYSTTGQLIPYSNDILEEIFYVNGLELTLVPEPTYTAQRRLWYGAGYVPDTNQVYQGMTEDIARLVIIKAEELVLRLQAREAAASSGGMSYQFGDVKVDKKSKADTLQKQAAAKEAEFDRAVAQRRGPVGILA